MTDDSKPTPAHEKVPDDAAPHNPGLGPKPDDVGGEETPSKGAPYDKAPEPAQQPS